ncbi:class II aldolase/adducin family protein [Candidatus Margulisiibacteriota bacterium]
MNNIEQLVKMSRYAGNRFDLVQSGVGNSSVKLENGEMLIKASGVRLSQVSRQSNIATVSLKKVRDILTNPKLLSLSDKKTKEKIALNLIGQAIKDNSPRPSIETIFHAMFESRYVLHTHPIAVNLLVCRKNWRQVSSELFDSAVMCVDYKTPGVELAFEVKAELKKYEEKYGTRPTITFLQNHGLIINTDSFEEIIPMTEQVLGRLEDYFEIDTEKFKQVTKIADLINGAGETGYIAYLSQDQVINSLLPAHRHLFEQPPVFPAKVELCGISVCEIQNITDQKVVQKYQQQYFEWPKVVIFKNKVFFLAVDLHKAREMESVFKAHLLTLLNIKQEELNYLEGAEVEYLKNWEVDKYRNCGSVNNFV